jgi:hypothetical protein
MSTQSMLSVVCILALGGVSAALYLENQALSERLDALEVQTDMLNGVAERRADGDAAPGLEGASVSKDDFRLLSASVDALAERVDDGEAEARADDGRPESLTPKLDEAMRELVLDMAGDVRFRTKLGLTGSPNLPKKPAFGQLADVLKLDASQEDAFRKDLGELQQDVFALLAEERDDGVMPLEEIARAEELAQGDPKRAEVFITLFTLKIPGGEETYMQRVVEWTVSMRKRTQKYLRPEQTEIFNAIDVDLLGVQLGG